MMAISRVHVSAIHPDRRPMVSPTDVCLGGGITAATTNGGTAAAAYFRGPTGAYGGVASETRAAAWTMRGRAETAFAAPDGSPGKGVFHLSDQRRAGALGRRSASPARPSTAAPRRSGGRRPETPIPRSARSACRPWAIRTTSAAPSPSLRARPTPARKPVVNAGQVTGFTSPWMNWYLIYALGREKELGFAVEPILAKTAPFLVGMVNSSLPQMINNYWLPVADGNHNLARKLARGRGDIHPQLRLDRESAPANSVIANYESDLRNDGYPAYAIAAGAMAAGEPGGAAAWNWLHTNPYPAIDFADAPKWNLVPRIDANILPAQPTAVP